MSFKEGWLLRISIVTTLALVLTATVGIFGAKAAQGGPPTVDASQLKQLSASMSKLHSMAQLQGLAKAAQAQTLANAQVKEPPMFSSSFTFNGQTFPFTMVGSDPALGSKTSHVKTILIPVSTHFPDQNITLFNKADADKLTDSPIFSRNHVVVGDRTQFTDALQRNQFHNFVSTVSPNYHVLLNQPEMRRTVKLELPFNTSNEVADLVLTVRNTNIQVGIVDINFFVPWIENQVLAMHLPTDTLPVFQFHDIFLNFGSIDPKNLQCCVLGFHDAFTPASRPNEIHTFIYESFTTAGIFQGVSDVSVMSHEAAEWVNDPFGNNPTPPWVNAGGGCQTNLETGDFLEGMPGASFKVAGFTFQDETNLWWFARTPRPTPATAGNYDFLGTLTTPSTPC
ncbi:MAG TPA: hypothetical protein VKY19_27330 [Ktedonosporobacter sp.]|nr:hypothetical protein [Ktedonosporobacter sp.]